MGKAWQANLVFPHQRRLEFNNPVVHGLETRATKKPSGKTVSQLPLHFHRRFLAAALDADDDEFGLAVGVHIRHRPP